MGGQIVIGLDRSLVGHKKVLVVCDRGQDVQSGGAVGRDFGAKIHEGEKVGESGKNDREFLPGNGECDQIPYKGNYVIDSNILSNWVLRNI